MAFGQDDTLFNPAKILGTDDNEKITQKEIELFWSKYYPKEVAGGASLTFRVLPGTHLGPVEYYKQYTEQALKGTNELRVKKEE